MSLVICESSDRISSSQLLSTRRKKNVATEISNTVMIQTRKAQQTLFPKHAVRTKPRENIFSMILGFPTRCVYILVFCTSFPDGCFGGKIPPLLSPSLTSCSPSQNTHIISMSREMSSMCVLHRTRRSIVWVFIVPESLLSKSVVKHLPKRTVLSRPRNGQCCIRIKSDWTTTTGG